MEPSSLPPPTRISIALVILTGALLVFDLDSFKEINDTYGHHVGDGALRAVAAVLRSLIRPYDICARYAGDEFIVVLRGCGLEEAQRKRLEAQRTVDATLFHARPSRSVPLAVSIGAAIFPRDGDTYEALLATADRRMYRTKSRRKQTPLQNTSGGDGHPMTPEPQPIEPSDIGMHRASLGLL